MFPMLHNEGSNGTCTFRPNCPSQLLGFVSRVLGVAFMLSFCVFEFWRWYLSQWSESNDWPLTIGDATDTSVGAATPDDDNKQVKGKVEGETCDAVALFLVPSLAPLSSSCSF